MNRNRSTQLDRNLRPRRPPRPPHSHMNIMSLALDPLVVPQLNDPFRKPDETYAQSLMSFIDFMHESDNETNPLDIYAIY